jgi:hypothetical protein
LNLETFNQRLRFFDYGPIMINAKPSEIIHYKLRADSDTLGQHSHQTLVLLYILPFITADVVSGDDEHWRVIELLFDTCDIVFSPCISRSNASHLADLIAQHHTLFKEVYKRGLKYKHHRMVHYPSVLLKNGPLLSIWVMRYEAKHNYFKRLAHIVCNF